mmetsp:Transcript_136011/g.240408  ORF Transcript_136011/g.240408 Transcript_136011/m.240408 type:complete len:236 (-) Transcript_136011:62-769(-)
MTISICFLLLGLLTDFLVAATDIDSDAQNCTTVHAPEDSDEPVEDTSLMQLDLQLGRRARGKDRFRKVKTNLERALSKDVPEEIKGTEWIMRQKAHGTCVAEPPETLRWESDRDIADDICCFNRDFAEYSGYWKEETTFLQTESAASGEITFYDTITGKPLFIAPRNRTFEEFVEESLYHGWPSFRDAEVVMENVRVLVDGETVSVNGTHLGHNLPDEAGNRYCIDIVCVAGFGH